MGGDELPRPLASPDISQPGQAATGQVMDGDASADIGIIGIDIQLAGQLADIDQVIFDMKSAGAVEIVPLVQIISPVIEDLDPAIFSVGYIDFPSAIGADTVGQVELAGVCSIITPGEKMSPVGCVFMDPGVAITIGDIKLTSFGIERDFGGPVKGLTTALR